MLQQFFFPTFFPFLRWSCPLFPVRSDPWIVGFSNNTLQLYFEDHTVPRDAHRADLCSHSFHDCLKRNIWNLVFVSFFRRVLHGEKFESRMRSYCACARILCLLISISFSSDFFFFIATAFYPSSCRSRWSLFPIFHSHFPALQLTSSCLPSLAFLQYHSLLQLLLKAVVISVIYEMFGVLWWVCFRRHLGFFATKPS